MCSTPSEAARRPERSYHLADASCTALRDSLDEARQGLPVPDQKSNSALRSALDVIALGTEDCFEGARGPNIPQLEKSFSELREGDALLDLARHTIEAWAQRAEENAEKYPPDKGFEGGARHGPTSVSSSAGGAVPGGDSLFERG